MLWAADAEEVAGELRATVDHFVPLQAVLDLRPHTVALFVDYENVARSLAKQGCNIVVAGGFGSGKTTFANVLLCSISGTGRVVLVEDTLRCQKYVDPKVLRRWYGAPQAAAASTESYLGLFRVLSLEMWMRAFRIS